MFGLRYIARNMRKEPIIAVVDEESDFTYYDVKETEFEKGEGKRREKGEEIEKAIVVENLNWKNFYGKLTKEKRLLLSLVEAA